MATKTFLVGPALDRAIRSIATSEDPRCAVAFLGSDAATIFKGGKAQIICNLASGSTSPSAVKELQEQGHEVRQNNRLHAKVYTGGKKALIASANLSANGLGLQDAEVAHWIEAGGYTEDVDDVARWFKTLWDDKLLTRAISNSDLRAAAELWKQRRSFKPTVSFSEFDAQAADVPLIAWYDDSECEINPTHTEKVKDGRTRPEWLDNFYTVEAEIDHTILAPGTWLLWWRLNADGGPSRRTACSWFRAGPAWRDFVKIDRDKKWRNAIIAQTQGIPPPFDCKEPLFNKAFREVITRPVFKALRARHYDGSFLHDRVCQMRKMWPVLQDAYRKEKARAR